MWTNAINHAFAVLIVFFAACGAVSWFFTGGWDGLSPIESEVISALSIVAGISFFVRTFIRWAREATGDNPPPPQLRRLSYMGRHSLPAIEDRNR